MNEIKAYQCSVCNKIYSTEQQAQHCENQCKDICDYKQEIKFKVNSNNIELGYNVRYPKTINRYYLETDDNFIIMNTNELDCLIDGLEELKRAWMKKN